MMENIIIWIVIILVAAIILVPSIRKHRKTMKKDLARKKEAVMLGADKAIAQHPQIDEFKCIGCGACVEACPEGSVLGIVMGKATIINGLKCVGHGLCAEACPVEGIVVGLGDTSHRDDIPFMKENRETNLPGVYIAGELGGLALIKNAINQGKEVVEDIARRTSPASNGILDVLVVGAGPSGMSAALTAVKHRLSYLVIDQEDAGGTILQYPRKKLVMTKPVDIPLYGTLKRPEYTKEELLDIWGEVIEKTALNIEKKCKLVALKRVDDHYVVETSSGPFRARHVVMALGRRGTPRKLGVPGEHKSKVMYKLLDAESFNHNHILVVGGGDSAIEAAMGLARQPGNKVILSYRKEKFFRIKQRNQNRLDTMVEEKKLKVVFNSNLKSIEDNYVQLEAGGKLHKLRNDFVFIFAGGEPPFALLKKCGIQFGGSSS